MFGNVRMFPKLPEKAERFSVSLPADVIARLKAEAKATDRTASVIVRRALESALPKR